MAKASTKTNTPAAAGAAAPALNAAALFKVVEASRSGGVAFLSQAEGEGLLSAGFITINAAQTDPNDASKVAAYPTEAGAKFYDENGGEEEAGDEGKAAVSYEIDSDVPLATKRRGAIGTARESVYPFAKLDIGQSFHVPVSKDMPKPNRTLGSAVSNATKSFAVEDLDGNGQKQFYAHEIKDKDGNVTGTEQRVKMKNTRVFTVRAVGADDPRGEGARVYRTA